MVAVLPLVEELNSFVVNHAGLNDADFQYLYVFISQANVYHATTSSGEELAVKVYKTSILVFK